jgi:muramoyltetrapeptide carboxypeptidase LdcA involved in peptidoglycan recycling
MDPSPSRDYARTVQKPRRLQPGDVAAIASPSWGGPAAFPATYEAGLRVLRDLLGLRVRELPHARDVAASPRERAEDLNLAFRDPEVRLVLASIGGDDSILVLPHLDVEAARRDPKIVMGYSDTTTVLVWLAQLGVVSFHGPSVMAGLAQASALPEAFLDHVRRVLFAAEAVTYAPYGAFCEGYADWGDPANAGRTNALRADEGPRWLQGRGTRAGPLLGGCLEVLEFLRGTPWLPLDGATWDGRVLFFETSEEAPPPRAVKRMLRSYGARACSIASPRSWWAGRATTRTTASGRSTISFWRSSPASAAGPSCRSSRTSTSATRTRSGSCRSEPSSRSTARPGRCGSFSRR